jgi:hypothetical protein
MVETQSDFRMRVGLLGRKHAEMAKGYTTVVRNDGLVVVKTKPVVTRRYVPTRGLILLVLGFFLFKSFMLASLSEITYNERVAKLGQGSLLEQAGAWVMQLDPITTYIAGWLEPVSG